jgi:hypothetical protein
MLSYVKEIDYFIRETFLRMSPLINLYLITRVV